MTEKAPIPQPAIPAWHRSLLAAAAVFTVLLVPYTVVGAVFWGLLAYLAAVTGFVDTL